MLEACIDFILIFEFGYSKAHIIVFSYGWFLSEFSKENKKGFPFQPSQNHAKTCMKTFNLVLSFYFSLGRIFPQRSNYSS